MISDENYLKIIWIANDTLTKIRNYIKENKKMFMKILMELNTTLQQSMLIQEKRIY